MKPETKWMIGIGVILVLIIVGFFVFKNKAATKDSKTAVSLGTTKSGRPITEEMVQKEMKSIKGTPDWYKKIVDSKGSLTEDEALRGNAMWMLENID